MRNYFLFFCLLIFFNSCQKEVENNIDTSIIEVEFMINRFEQYFYNLALPAVLQKAICTHLALFVS